MTRFKWLIQIHTTLQAFDEYYKQMNMKDCASFPSDLTKEEWDEQFGLFCELNHEEI